MTRVTGVNRMTMMRYLSSNDDEVTDRHSPNPLIDFAHPGGWGEGKYLYFIFNLAAECKTITIGGCV